MPTALKTKYWVEKENSNAHFWLTELSKDLIDAGMPIAKFYLTESYKHVPMLIIEGNKTKCSIAFMGKRNIFRLFTNYYTRATKLDIVAKMMIPKQTRHDFSLPINKILLDFILTEKWDLSEFKKERYYKHGN